MATSSESVKARLSVNIDPELQQRVRAAAAKKELSLHDYVNAVLQHALIAEDNADAPDNGATWAQLSGRAFARDWNSPEDEVYDSLS